MPSTYAHYRFGRDVIQRLPETWSDPILRCRDLYDIGVHGPDLLFFYRPVFLNPIVAIGFDAHKKTGRVFFGQAAKVARAACHSLQARAYVAGLLTHFALDSICHPCVEQEVRNGRASHAEIEVSFDRFLLLKDGRTPIRQKLCEHIRPSTESAAVIAPFFPPATVGQVLIAERSIICYNNWLVAPRAPKRLLVKGALRLSGNYEELHGLLMTREQNSACLKSDERLYVLYQQALFLAAELFREMEDCLEDSGHLGGGFNHTFGAE